MIEKTVAIIKPDAVINLYTGAIIEYIELNGFHIESMKKVRLTQVEAEQFYAVHKQRPFFGELISYIISGPIVVMKLARKNCVQELRNLIGATDPKEAQIGTIRKMFGTEIGSNAMHGSDSQETAKTELSFFFGTE